MRLVFLGPPGAGKGTQASVIAEEHGVPHISTGDILRNAIKLATPTGIAAQDFMDRGEFVPFAIILQLVKDRLKDSDASGGWVLDGFPRNLDQATAFAELLAEIDSAVDRAVYFKVSSEEVVRRLGGRRICRECQAPFHVAFSPPKQEGVCDQCEGELYQRTDDVEDKILTRLEVYARETDPLVQRYDDEGILLTIHGEQQIDKVLAEVRRGLSSS